MTRLLPQSFYEQPTLELAKALLGKLLWTESSAGRCSGEIVEVEAYIGGIDSASHSHKGRSRRNDVMFWPAGHCYVYLIYGIHHCVNVVSESAGIGAAVLVRALAPIEGQELMRERRGCSGDRDLTNGPGRLCQALAIDSRHLGEHFSASPAIGIEEHRLIDPQQIASSRRIGITKSTELEWRFFVMGDKNVSKGRPSGLAEQPRP